MARRLRAAAAPITIGLLLINGLIWLGQISPWGQFFTNQMFFAPLLAPVQPWRMITSGFVHDPYGPLHILMNSYAIWIFGTQLEPMLGRLRFLALYMTSILGGSVAILWLSDPRIPVVGASGALFGLMGAYFIVLRSLGSNPVQLFILIAINFSLGLFVEGISWQGHLGGLVVGAAVAGVYAETRRPNQKAAQFLGILLILGVLVGLSYFGATVWLFR